MRKATLIVLAVTLSIINSGCNSIPSTPEVTDPVATNSESSTTEVDDAVASNSEPSTPELSAEDQFNLGDKYRKGEGVPQDFKEAMKWYRLAADQRHAHSQTELGIIYRRGNGVPQDYKEAMKLSRLAAEKGDSIAQNSLGVMYSNGEDVPQNDKEAYIWFSLSAANGYEMDKNNVTNVKAKLSPEQLIEAQTRATELHKQIEERQSCRGRG
jgi:hypothetical protein